MKNQNRRDSKNQKILLCSLVLIFIQTACTPFSNLRKVLENPLSSDSYSSQSNKTRPADTPNFDSASGVVKMEIYRLLLMKDFHSIEKIANEAREKKERLEGGYWKLDSIYEGLTAMYAENTEQVQTDEMWRKRIELFKQWKENSPQSITARITLAKAYIEYGEFARGGGYIDTVSSEGYKLLHERLDLAEKELLEARELSTKCPRWYREVLFIAMFKGWENEEFEKIFEEAVNLEPNYLQFYLVKSEYLTPKWSGSQPQWEKFVEALPEKLATLNTDEANIIYFVVVVNKMKEPSLSLNFAMFPRETIRQGFADLEKKYKTDNLRLNQFAYLCTVNGDYFAAHEAFQRIGIERNREVWSEKQFNSMKEIASQAGNTSVRTN